MHRNVDRMAVPAGRTVVHFQFPDVPARSRRWWLVITVDDVDVCDTDPGHDIDVTVNVDLRSMTQIWLGDVTWSDAIRAGSMTVEGPDRLRRALPRWLRLSPFASVPRASESRAGGNGAVG